MTLSDQADSYLEVITCSLKALAYHIPLSLMILGELCYTQILSPSCDKIYNTFIFPQYQTWSENSALDVDPTYKTPTPLSPLSL